jgi:membrane fusion protein, multidrug efflux system
MPASSAARRLVGAALVALVVVACGKASGASGPAGKPPPRAYRVTTVPVAARPLTYAVDALGSLEAFQVVTVPARVEGTLGRLAFDEGTAVTPETELARIDERRYALGVDHARAALAESEAAAEEAKASATKSAAQTARVRAELDEAQANLARVTALREKNPGWVSEERLLGEEARAKSLAAQLDEAAAGETQAAAKVRATASAVDARRVTLALAEKDAEDARVRSPIAGTVEARHVAEGQYVKVGDRIATLVDTHILRLRFTVGEAQSVQMRKGLPVSFRVAAFPERSFQARIFHVDRTADPTTRMVECLADVEDAEGVLRPGFFATVGAEIARESDAIVIPTGALLSTEEGFVAFAVVGEGVERHAEKRRLKLGLHTREGDVEVVEGLRAGETIALKGAQSLRDGVKVDVVSEGAAKAAPAPAPAKSGERR